MSGNARQRRVFERLFGPILEELERIRRQHEEMVKSGKPKFDWGFQAGVWGVLLMLLSLFIPVRSPYFIVPSMVVASVFLSASLLSGFWLYPFNARGKKTHSAAAVFFVLALAILSSGKIWPVTTYEPTELRQMSAEELKKVENKLVTEMREYQAQCDKKVSPLEAELERNPSAQSMAALAQWESEYREGFFKDYLIKGLAVRAEFLWRLGKTPEQAEPSYSG